MHVTIMTYKVYTLCMLKLLQMNFMCVKIMTNELMYAEIITNELYSLSILKL